MESVSQNMKTDLKSFQQIKQIARYNQLDDFAVIGTPPVGGEGPLFTNIFGNRSVERTESMYDRINRELSGAEKQPVTSIDKDNFTNNICASISVGLSGICVKPTQQTVITSPEQSFIIPSDDKRAAPRLSIGEATQTRFRKVSHFDSKHVDQDSLINAFNELKALKEDNNIDHISAPVISLIEPLPSLSERQRKSSAPPSLNPGYVMDSNKSSMANFFFNGGLTSFCSKMSSNSSTPETSILPVINTDQKISVVNSVGNGDSNNLAFNTSPPISPGIERKKVLRRRPKKTAFREMNLWAPQSM